MKKVIEFFKTLKSKPYGKSVFFFGFYLIFFIVIFVILGVSGKGKKDILQNKTSNIKYNYLEKYNYSFDYKVLLDNVTYNYIGNKDAYKFNYTYNNKEYYNDKNNSYIKEEDWVIVENPIKFNKLLNEEVVNNILDSSYIEAKTTYDSGALVYSLLISSNTLSKILDNKDTDYIENPNRIKLTIDEDKNISEINYNLDSYCKMEGLCKGNLSIIIDYKEFNKK